MRASGSVLPGVVVVVGMEVLVADDSTLEHTLQAYQY